MAITPELARKLVPDEELQVKRLEELIDGHLRQTPAGYSGGWTYNLPETPSEKVVRALIGLYTAAGWKVKREHGDQREPAKALYFTPAEYSQEEI